MIYPGYSKYRITENGKFFNLKGKAMTSYESSGDTETIRLENDEKTRVRVNVLIAITTAYHGPPPFEGAKIIYLNGKEKIPKNLRWSTLSELKNTIPSSKISISVSKAYEANKISDSNPQTPINKIPIPQTPITKITINKTPIPQKPITKIPIPQKPIIQTTISKNSITQTPIPQTSIIKITISKDPITETISQDSITQTSIIKTTLSQDPIIETIISQDPIIETIISQDPITQTPNSQDLTSQDPITQTPNSQDPITQTPNSQDLTSQDPITQTPNSQDPITQTPNSQDLTSQDPISTNNELKSLVKKELKNYFSKYKILIPPHEPIYQKFVNDVEEYNLDDAYEENCIIWKRYRDLKGKIHPFIEISSDGIVRNFNTKFLIKISQDTSKREVIKITKDKYLLVIDIVASTYLKIPKTALFAVHKSVNKEKRQKKRKYQDQSNHYKNLKWVKQEDLAKIANKKGYFISKYGDVYSNKKGFFNLLTETESNLGLKYISINGSDGSTRNKIHETVAKYFLTKPGEDYKFVVHKDGDLSNNHYKNLIYLNTLAGIHNDHMLYYAIPNCSYYVLDDEDKLYSFKYGVLKRQGEYQTKLEYITTSITNDEGKEISPMLHTIIAAAHFPFDENKPCVDHKDRKKGHNIRSNLRRATYSENSKNVDRKPPRYKRVMQYNMKGDLIKIYDSAKIAGKELQITHSSILKCANKNKNKDDFPHCTGSKFRWTFCEQDKYKIKEGEKFKPVVISEKYEINAPDYLLSDNGILIGPDGYRKYIWGGKRCYKICKVQGVNYFIHILVALLFIEGRSEIRNQVNHIDEDLENYTAENLEWCSQSENIKHSIYRQYKKVHQVDPETSLIIKTFPSRADAAEAMNGNRVNTGTIISSIKNPMKSLGYGYYWLNAVDYDFDEENNISEDEE